MRNRSAQLRTLLADLQREDASGVIKAKQIDQIALWLCEAFEDDLHPARAQLDAIRSLIRSPQLQSSDGEPLLPERLFFMAQPGSATVETRKLWRLQLLLCVAINSVHYRNRLVAHLLGSERQLPTKAVEQGWEFGLGHLTALKIHARLIDALALLDAPLSNPTYRLDGDNLVESTGLSVSLGPVQARMMRLLLSRPGASISIEQLKAQGVKNPSKTKHDLVKSATVEGISLRINFGDDGYMLQDS